MKKKVSKLSLNKKSVSNLNQLKGGLRRPFDGITVGETCEGLSCLATCDTSQFDTCAICDSHFCPTQGTACQTTIGC